MTIQPILGLWRVYDPATKTSGLYFSDGRYYGGTLKLPRDVVINLMQKTG